MKGHRVNGCRKNFKNKYLKILRDQSSHIFKCLQDIVSFLIRLSSLKSFNTEQCKNVRIAIFKNSFQLTKYLSALYSQ